MATNSANNNKDKDAWLNHGYQQNYQQNYQQYILQEIRIRTDNTVKDTINSLYRWDQQNASVVYVRGYQVPYERWLRNPDGTWLDMVPQFPTDSIYFDQLSLQRRNNQSYLYGHTLRMGC